MLATASAPTLRVYLTILSTGLSKKPYIVLLGDVGAGKSTLVEKVTGLKGRSSGKGRSFTKKASYALSTDNSLIISDTPGVNVISDKLAQNVWITQALNLQPVSQILITVKADTRMENVINRVQEYSSKLSALDKREAVGLVVTNMDNREIDWTESDFCAELEQSNIPIGKPIFSKKDIIGSELLRQMHDECKNSDGSIKQFDMNIDSENFQKIFKPSQNERLSNDAIVREKKRMALASESFFETFDQLGEENEKMDLLFEFQAWSVSEMIEAQKRVAEDMQPMEADEKDEAELMHRLDYLKDVLIAELHKVKKRADDYSKKYKDAVLRTCPKCGTPWTKAEGCDGLTTCGEQKVSREESNSSLASFHFEWVTHDGDGTPEKLKITRDEEKEASEKVVKDFERQRQEEVNTGRVTPLVMNKISEALTAPTLELLLEQKETEPDTEWVKELTERLTFPGLKDVPENQRDEQMVNRVADILRSLRMEHMFANQGVRQEETGTSADPVIQLAETLTKFGGIYVPHEISSIEVNQLEEAIRRRQETWEKLSNREKEVRRDTERRMIKHQRDFNEAYRKGKELWVKLSDKEREEKLEKEKMREDKREKERIERFKLSGRKGCGAKISWKEMKPLPPDQIPVGLSWAAADVKKPKNAVRAFEDKLEDLISKQKPRFDLCISNVKT